MGNRQSTDAFDPNVTHALNHPQDGVLPSEEAKAFNLSAGTSAGDQPPSTSSPALEGGGTVPSYFGLLSCSTIDVVPQTHQPLLAPPRPPPLQSAASSRCGGGFDNPMASVTDIWLMAGQSNAVGENGPDGQGVPDIGQPLPEHMSLFTPEGRWTALTQPCSHLGVHGYDDARSVGPDVAFANTLLALGCSTAVGIVPTAAGATNLHTQWAPGGMLYTYAVSQVKASMAALPGARLRGVIWIQGEADAEAGHAADAAAYGERLEAFIGRLRHDLSTYHPCLPVVLGVMATRQRSYFEYIHQIRQAQLELDMPNVIKVDLAGFEFFEQFDAQLVHVSKAGQCALGTTMAYAYYAAMHSPRIMSPKPAA